MNWVRHHILRFARSEQATATVEFVIVFPVIIMMFLAVFESGAILLKQVMLERALDQTVRFLRITPLADDVPSTQIAAAICDNVVVIPIDTCNENLELDLRAIDQVNYYLPDGNALCVDRQNLDVRPANTFRTGRNLQNQLMLVRACMVVDRILPFSGFGLNLTRDDTGGVHMVTSTIFVNEPTPGG